MGANLIHQGDTMDRRHVTRTSTVQVDRGVVCTVDCTLCVKSKDKQVEQQGLLGTAVSKEQRKRASKCEP